MIIVLTTRDHTSTFESFARREYGFPTPRVRTRHYDRLLGARKVARATYVFADLERLAPWELRHAGDLYRRMTASGLRCLNDPVRAMARVELLRTLHRLGINPFDVHRADEGPRPTRFPVFVRSEADHRPILSDLLADQNELDAALAGLRRDGRPLRGVVVIEQCSEPYRPGLWHKWGSFRIGARISVDHIAVDGDWMVKYGAWEKLDDAVVADEHAAVTSNRFAAELEKVFDVAGIEFGRADHASVGGRTVVYEINTNPRIGRFVPDRIPLRARTQSIARTRMAEMLGAIDCEQTGSVALEPPVEFKLRRIWRFGSRTTRRP